MWVHDAADRFEHASAHDLLAWAIETFHPRLAISAAGGVDGMALIDMAWRIDPTIRVFTLDTGRLPPETYTLFEEVRDRYGIQVEFEVPEGAAVSTYETANGPNAMYRSVDLRTQCCTLRKVEPLKRKLATLDAWIAGLRREQWISRRNIAKVELDRDHGGVVKLNPLADWTARRRVGLRARERGALPRALRPRLRLDRVRAVHPRRDARRIRARRPLVVGAGHEQGVRHPLLRPAAGHEDRQRTGHRRRRAHDVRPHAGTDRGPRHGDVGRRPRPRRTTPGRRSRSRKGRSPSAGCG